MESGGENKGTLEFVSSLDAGKPGTDPNPNNVASRTLRVLFHEGKPQRAIAFLYYHGIRGEASPLRWLGSLVLTDAKQILFFPASELEGRLYAEHGSREMTNRSFRIEHVTLEPDRESWHLTEPRGRGERQRGPGTYPAGNDRYVWCGMSLSSEKLLPPTYRETEVSAPVPDSDGSRRGKETMKAIEAAPDRIISLPPDARAGRQLGFPHFIFLVGPEGFEVPDDLGYPFPVREGWVEPQLPTGFDDLPAGEATIALPTGEEVKILGTWLPGRLQMPLAFSSK